MFQRQFHFIGEDDRHWSLLQHADRAGFGQAVGSQLFALQRVDFITKSSQTDLLAGWDESQRQARSVVVFRFHVPAQSACSAMLNRPPIKKANGTMTATMTSAVFVPCSLTIIIKLAKQGMNRVMVIMPTTA